MHEETDQPATILVVDDTEANIDVLIKLLREYDVVVAMNGPAALDILQSEPVDIVLLDIMMPDMDGYEVCRRMKSDASLRDIPVLFITAISNEENIEKAFDMGGVDYVTKPFKPKELMARIRTQLKLRQTLKALEYQATRDALTGIYNRRRFFELGQTLFADTPENHFFAVMMDLDHFKGINDTYGHAFGDQVLKTFAAAVKNFLHPTDIFGRLGGEEFCLLCTAQSQMDIMSRVEGMRKDIENIELCCHQKTVRFTISKGVAAKTATTPTLDEILRQADLALYEAKGGGATG